MRGGTKPSVYSLQGRKGQESQDWEEIPITLKNTSFCVLFNAIWVGFIYPNKSSSLFPPPAEDGDGNKVVTRGCLKSEDYDDYDDYDSTMDVCGTQKIFGTKTVLCLCNSNFCNSAPPRAAAAGGVVLAAAVTLLISQALRHYF